MVKLFIAKCMEGANAHKPGPCPDANSNPAPQEHQRPQRENIEAYTAAAQQHAKANQDKLAASLPGARAIAGNAPSDVERESCDPQPCRRQQFELKTLLVSKKGRAKQTPAAQARKLLRRDDGPPPPIRRQFTVIVDHRQAFASGKLDSAAVFPCYVKEGTGTFSLNNMHRVDTAEELDSLVNTAPHKLPEKAKAPLTGFYAKWSASGPKGRKALAEQAFKQEKDRAQAHQERRRQRELLP